MLTTLVGALLTGGLCAGSQGDSLERLYDRGKSFAEFLTTVKSRRETWTGNYSASVVPAELLARARALRGRWRLLVVAEDWCGDSANTIPYLASLVDSAGTLELKIVDSRAGKFLMERHRTPDGRAATPTVVLLDSHGAEAGCFIERPAALRAWLESHKATLTESELQKGRDAWRREDGGRATLEEFVELLEAAARGAPRC